MKLWRHSVLMLALILGASLCFAPAAQAAGELELSRDGSSWGQSLPGPLFDSAQKLVPGSSISAEFWVRNGAASAGKLSVELNGALGELLQSGLLGLSLTSSSGTSWNASSGQSPRLLVAQIAPGSRQKLTLQASLAAAAANDTQLRKVPVSLQLILSESVESGATVQPALPNTGVVLLPLFLGSALAIGGYLAVWSARRRQSTEAGLSAQQGFSAGGGSQ
ncbi:hypothetical protein FHU41_002829 [Psychromicrobium silvestre]|uniref:Gram-positive cocci surface proteins LPxTG domain-containing protein n=1 Tax=Psychromicrobium silvestre TaxID=1645614 RepID=A0A7Y9LVW6_9MICC|nr:hypothetical protein [Psychromicrobium silvestre]NYE96579.1 hypothetical protein [Psychromicrobium silvestre]